MATRTAYMDYVVRGADGGARQVRTLGDAVAYQKREALAAVPAMRAAQQGTGFFGAVAQSSTAKVAGLTNTLGPLGAGLGHIAREGPLAAQGLLAVVAQQERMTLLSRAANIAILGGASAMAAGAVAAVAYADNIIRGADAYSAMLSRIRMFSDGQVEAAQTERALFQMGRDTRQGVEQLTTLYTRLTPAVLDANRSQAEALQLTELSAKALLIQGANTREAEASTVQFAQALASGVLRGDELRSLLESAPQLVRYIAQNLEMNGKIGVSFGQIRKLGEEGMLTTERIMAALLAASPQIERDFVNAPKTAQQGWTILKDTITRTVGQLAQATGFQASVVDFLGNLSSRLDAFRSGTLLNPDALNGVEEAGRIIGDTLDTAADLAGDVVENFDLIVDAAQAIIALKAGEVMVGWFTVAASKARELYDGVQRFRGNGLFLAGAANDQIGATAALQARAAAEAAKVRATDLAVQSDLKARTASAARAAADIAAAEAVSLKAAAGANAARVAEAEALASTLVTQADRAEAAAKTATTAATNAAAAASARNAIAQQAEAAVTAEVTGLMAAKAASGRALSAVYGFLGGGIGIATVALGGLIYAAYQSEEAFKRKFDALRDAVVASDELRAISEQLASATWDEVPALQAAAAAHRDKAIAAREDAQASLEAAQQRLNNPLSFISNAFANPFMNANNARQVNAWRSVVDAGNADRAKSEREYRIGQTNYSINSANSQWEANRTGRDLNGEALTTQQRAANDAALQRARDDAASRRQPLVAEEARISAALGRNPQDQTLAQSLSMVRRELDAVNQLARAASGQRANALPPGSPQAASGGSKRASMSSEDRQVLSVLEKVADAAALRDIMGKDAGGQGRFRIDGATITVDGQPFTAASEDEARAVLAYREQINAAVGATDDLIAKSGATREALVQQAADTLNAALATSQAAQAQQAWAQRLAEARGESQAEAQAQAEIARAREQGAKIVEEEAQAYIALAVAKERARRSEAALGVARPIVQDVVRRGLDEMGPLPQRWNAALQEMGVDIDAAMRQWADARVRFEDEALAKVREKNAADNVDAQTAAENLAAVKVALELASAEEIAELWRRLREEDQEAWRLRLDERLQQERDLSDSITGSLRDLAMGADSRDVGQRFMSDLLEAAWQELVTNPLGDMIRNWLRSMASGQGGGGLYGFFGQVLGGMLPGGSTATLPTTVPTLGSIGFADGGLPGVLKPGMIRGPGGPRDDRIPAWVSNEEFIVNAKATKANLGWLTAINAGYQLPAGTRSLASAFANGGLPGADWRTAEANRDIASAAVVMPPPMIVPTVVQNQPVVPITLINQTSENVEASQTVKPDGSIEVVLRKAVRSEVGKMGGDGALNRALKSTPQPKRR